jgi:hypothetical protein
VFGPCIPLTGAGVMIRPSCSTAAYRIWQVYPPVRSYGSNIEQLAILELNRIDCRIVEPAGGLALVRRLGRTFCGFVPVCIGFTRRSSRPTVILAGTRVCLRVVYGWAMCPVAQIRPPHPELRALAESGFRSREPALSRGEIRRWTFLGLTSHLVLPQIR